MIVNNENGYPSLKRIIAFFGFIAMTVAFCVLAWYGKISADMFLTYPVGLIILYVPSLAIKLLQIWRGNA